MIRLVLFALLLAACDCGTDPGCTSNDDCGGLVCVDGSCVMDADAAPPDTATDAPDAGLMCVSGQASCGELCCESGEVCDGDSCCPGAELCGGDCCSEGAECVAERCITTCAADETLCGPSGDETCCDATDVCYLGACTTPGIECTSTGECPDNEYCEPAIGRCLPRAMGEECVFEPDGDFTLQEEWNWSGSDVMPAHVQVIQSPIVANLTDDNLDGRIDDEDTPDVIFSTFVGNLLRQDGVLRAVSGADGSEHWPAKPPSYRVQPAAQIAVAELDSSSPGPEIVACSVDEERPSQGEALIIASSGELIRTITGTRCTSHAAAIADADHDGTPEIFLGTDIFHADGTLLAEIPVNVGGQRFANFANVVGDADLEIVAGNAVFSLDGSIVWVDESVDPLNGQSAVADLNLDTVPEVIFVSPNDHMMTVYNGQTGAVIWRADVNQAEAPPTSAVTGGGPPTVANFDDDPQPEIALAGGYSYVVFDGIDGDGDGLGDREWFMPTRDTSSRTTGSSIFDFNGDGRAEVVYNDERNLHVYNGSDGAELLTTCNTSATLVEYPVVVDVDLDGQAEIILMANNYSVNIPQCDPVSVGIRSLGHPRGEWVSTRTIWNQYSYHVTNIEPDGTVPRDEEANWLTPGLNNFRQNVLSEGLFNASDLVAVDGFADTSRCPEEEVQLSVRVANEGSASVPAGVPVAFYDTRVARVLIGVANTTRRLLPGESERIEAPATYAVEDGAFTYEVVVNDPENGALLNVRECREENNTGAFEAFCFEIR